MLKTNVLMNHWGIHYLASLLARIPPSETRLRDEGIGAMYNAFRSMLDGQKDSVAKHGITAFSLPNISTDWKDEATTDHKTHHESLFPHLPDPVTDYIKFMTAALDKYHWTSLVAAQSAVLDMYFHSMDTTLTAMEAGVPGVQAMKNLLAPYASKATGLADASKVVREEIMKIRSAGEQAGWKEEEAKALAVEQTNRLKGMFN